MTDEINYYLERRYKFFTITKEIVEFTGRKKLLSKNLRGNFPLPTDEKYYEIVIRFLGIKITTWAGPEEIIKELLKTENETEK